MKVVEVNYWDLVGRNFNGYDLHLKLRENGIDAKQIVMDKRSDADSVICLKHSWMLHEQVAHYEKEHSISNLLMPYITELKRIEEFQNADIKHYHILHNRMFSLYDYPDLMKGNSVWTIHDPWIVTGNCVYPMTCEKWRTGCGNCERLDEIYYEMEQDNTNFMWEVKRKVFREMNPHVVVASEFMKRYMKESPLTEHFDKIHVIPFGVDISSYHDREELADENHIVIGFRADNAPVKGCEYIYEALRQISDKDRIFLMTVGAGVIPEDIRKTYKVQEHSWINDKQGMIDFQEACDIFIMPSLAESFGLMAIEAMAAGNAVICFKGTVLEDITNAPICGSSVEYKSSSALAYEIERLSRNPREIRQKGRMGRQLVEQKYQFDTYVKRHQELYESILKESLDGKGKRYE